MSLLAALALLFMHGSAQSEPPPGPASDAVRRIHVRGNAQISATAGRDEEGVVLRGELRDDAGGAIGHSAVALVATSPSGPVTMRLAHPCDRARRSASRAAADQLDLETDERGAFCLHLADLPVRSTFKLRVGDTADRDGIEVVVPVEAEPAPLRALLRFEPPPEFLDLDRESTTVTASLRIATDATRGAPSTQAKREGLLLVLEDERGHRLAEATTGGDGRARFLVPSALLGDPGKGALAAKFLGSDVLAGARVEQSVLRRADVLLELTAAPEAADADDGVALSVAASTSRGPVLAGVVEALRGLESVGAAPVEGGRARVIAAITTNTREPTALALRYVTAAPYLRVGTPLNVSIPPTHPSFWKQSALAALVAAIAAWVVGGWRRSALPKARAGKDVRAMPPPGRAGVHVLGATDAPGGWQGVVSDAHDGALLRGATLQILVPSLEGDGVAARAVADEHGAFTLVTAHRSDARLVVEAETHSTYEAPLPPPSILAVALVTRRRTLLDRLVRWARRYGAPFDSAPEPTPGHVRRAAARADAKEIESWARELEQTAYGGEPVGQAEERRVRAAEPRGIG